MSKEEFKKNDSNLKKIVVWVMIFFLVVVFVLSFIMEEIVQVSENTNLLGDYNGHPITRNHQGDFFNQYRYIYSNYEAQGFFSGGVDPRIEQYIMEEAFNQVVSLYAFSEEATKKHFFISNEDIRQQIVNSFSSEGGSLKDYGRLSLIERQTIESRVKSQLLASKIPEIIFPSVPSSQKEIHFDEELKQIERKIKILYIPFDKKYEEVLTDEVLEQFYNKNKENYEDYESAKSILEFDYINENEVELKDLIRMDIQQKIKKEQKKSLEELPEIIGGDVYISSSYNFRSTSIDFEGVSIPQGNMEKFMDSALLLPIGEISDTLLIESGVVVLEVIEQRLLDKAIEASSKSLYDREKQQNWLMKYQNILIKKNKVNRYF